MKGLTGKKITFDLDSGGNKKNWKVDGNLVYQPRWDDPASWFGLGAENDEAINKWFDDNIKPYYNPKWDVKDPLGTFNSWFGIDKAIDYWS